MGLIADAYKNATAAPEAFEPTVGGELSKGISRGLRGAGGQLEQIAGLGAEALGAPEFAQRRYAASKGLREAAAAPEFAAQTPTFDDVHDVGSFTRWGAGKVGEMAPVLGAAVAGGVATGNPIVGGALAMTPFEAGDIAQRQMEDPTAAQASAGERLLRAGAGGLASSVMMNVMPARLAGKIGGVGLRGEQALLPAVAKNVAEGAAVNAAGMGAGEATKQLTVNEGNPLNTSAIEEAALGGAVVGGVAHAPVGVASYLKGAAADVKSGSIAERLAARKTAPEADAAAPAEPVKVPSDLDAAKDFLRRGRDKLDSSVDDILGDRPLGARMEDLKGASADKIKELFKASDNEALNKAKQWGEDMMAKMPTDDPRVQAVKDAMESGSATAMAGLKKTWDAGQAAADHVKSFADNVRNSYDAFKKRDIDGETSDVSNQLADGTKKSEDYSAVRQAVVEELLPIIKRNRPELLDNNTAINDLAESVRQSLELVANGKLTDKALSKLTPILGTESVEALTRIHERVQDMGGDASKVESFFKNLNELDTIGKRQNSIHDLVRRSFTDDARTTDAPANVHEIVSGLIDHARGTMSRTGEKPSAAELRYNTLVGDHMKRLFGDKADAVSKAIEKEAGLGVERDATTGSLEDAAAKKKVKLDDGKGTFDEGGNRVEAAQTDRIVIGRGKGNAKMVDPDLFASEGRQGLNHAKQALLDAKAKYPDRNVFFERAEGSKEWGHIVAEKAEDPNSFNPAELEAMKPDAKYNTASNAGRLKVGDMYIDAVKVAKTMREKGYSSFEAPEHVTSRDRLVDAFKQGIAQLVDQTGAKDFKVPDNAVIGFIGGKKLTWGEAKRGNAEKNKAIDAQNADVAAHDEHIARLRAAYKKASGAKARAKIRAEADAAIADHEHGKDRELSTNPDDFKDTTDTTKPMKPSKDGQIHEAASTVKEKDLINRSNMDGSAHYVSDRADTVSAIGDLANELKARSSKIQQALGAKLADVLDKVRLNTKDLERLSDVLADKKPSAIAAIVDELASRKAEPAKGGLKSSMEKRQDYLDNPPKDFSVERVQEIADWAKRQEERLAAEARKLEAEGGDAFDRIDGLRFEARMLREKAEAMVKSDADALAADKRNGTNLFGGTPDPKAVAAKKAAFLERAASGDKGLIKELGASTDAKGLQRAAKALSEHAPDSEAMKAVNERLSQLVQDPDVAYSLGTKAYKSAESIDPNTTHASGSRPDIAAHIEKVLGKSVRLAWANLTHAGEYAHAVGQGVIRLSVHALDPMSTAYHESLHAFFAQLRDVGAHDITSVLEKAASSEHVLAQLRERFKDEPAVLKQLANPEERAAYMYQMWALDPKGFKVSIAAKSVFGKIADFIRQAVGLWTNDQRALHIMEYFNSGEYAKNLNQQSAVRRALMQPGRNQAWEAFHAAAEPLAHMADSVAGIGSSRIRDMGIPALNELADLIKRDHLDGSGKDQGFILSSRVEATKRRTALGEKLDGYTDAQLRDAMEGLQGEKPADTPEGRLAAREIKKFLAETRDYMVDAGVKVGDLGEDYFPRVWDTHYISKNLQAFRDMLEPYVRRGEMTGSVDDLVANLVSRDGNEFGIETREPGMQFAKERKLDFISAADATQFLNKNLHETLNSYLTQATRRAEWNRRMGGGKLERLWEEAKEQGASAEDLKTADRYLKGVDGTLGDSLNPHARRIMGNMIVYQNIRLLPMAAFSMLIDPNGVLVRGGSVTDAWSTFKRGMKDVTKAWSKDGPTPDEATRLAEMVGVVDSAMMSHTMGDIYTQGMVGGTAKTLNNAFFKYNLVESLNRSFRVGASEAAMKFIARHADGSASAHSKRWMRELNLEAGDVKLTPDGRIALTEGEGLTKAQVTKVHAAINQWVDGAVLRPDAADKPIWMNDPMFAVFAHLKQFVFSFQKTILERVIHEAQHQNYTPAMALASYVPIMMAADFTKGMILNGGNQPDYQAGWGPTDYVGYGMQRAGLFGVGQFGLDIGKDISHGNTGLFALAGPTLEQLRDGVETLGGHKQFGGTVIDAMPANALYKHSLGAPDGGGPMFSG